MSPGTIVLSDLRSAEAARLLGLRQAAYVATRVISSSPGRLTLDAGSKAINPDVPAPGCRVLGEPALHPQTPSEEHLPLRSDGQLPRRGAALLLVPRHVCPTVNLAEQAAIHRGGRIAGFETRSGTPAAPSIT